MRKQSQWWLGVSTGVLAASVLYGSWRPAGAAQSAAAVALNPQEASVLATLWMRTSGEYRALCLQTYGVALERLQVSVRTPEVINASRAGKPPAVIMDLDETVLDNSAFQAMLILQRAKFSEELFQQFIRDRVDQTRLVPGAREFIAAVEQLGITVVYISNRLQAAQASTVEALRFLGINVAGIDGRLLLSEGDSDKTARRDRVAARYTVLALFGDNLADFSDEFSPKRLKTSPDPIRARADIVTKEAAHWGVNWYILPNPVYGDWARLIDPSRPDKFLAQPAPLAN